MIHPGPVANEFPKRVGPYRIACVGESPGADELRLGRPFVGSAGLLLNRELLAVGLLREEVFVGNVSQFKPSEKSNDFWLLDWTSPEVQWSIGQLLRDLAAFQPHLVVCLGNVPLHLFKNGNVAPARNKNGTFKWPSKVTMWRGSLFHSSPALYSLCEQPGTGTAEPLGSSPPALSQGSTSPTVPGLSSNTGGEYLGRHGTSSLPAALPCPVEAGPEGTERNGGGYANMEGKALLLPTEFIATNSGQPQLHGVPTCVVQNAGTAYETEPAPGTVGEIPLNRSSYPVVGSPTNLPPRAEPPSAPAGQDGVSGTTTPNPTETSLTAPATGECLAEREPKGEGGPGASGPSPVPLLAASPNVNAGYPSRASQQVSKAEVASLDAGANPAAATPLPAHQWKCLCTLHPAFIQRQQSALFDLRMDLRKARAEGTDSNLDLPVLEVEWGPEQVVVEQPTQEPAPTP